MITWSSIKDVLSELRELIFELSKLLVVALIAIGLAEFMLGFKLFNVVANVVKGLKALKVDTFKDLVVYSLALSAIAFIIQKIRGKI